MTNDLARGPQLEFEGMPVESTRIAVAAVHALIDDSQPIRPGQRVRVTFEAVAARVMGDVNEAGDAIETKTIVLKPVTPPEFSDV